MNNNDGNKICAYYIYIPTCENKEFIIINSLNQNKSEDYKIRIKDLFKVYTDKYYLKFDNIPNEIGYFTLNGIQIDSNKILIESDEYILDFIIRDMDEVIDNEFSVQYFVFIESNEAYQASCHIKFKIILYDMSTHNCKEECKDNTFITSNGDCVLNCPNNTYQFSLNHSCLDSCPNGYEKSKTKNECIFKDFDQTISISDFKKQILSNISAFVNSSKVINGSNFLAVVLSSDKMDPEEQLKNGISAIDLGNCTQVLKEYYNISKEDNLILLNIESKKNKNENYSDHNSFNLGKNTQLEIFDYSGRKLDLSVCKEDIKVMKYIGDVTEELDIQSAMDLSEKGIDVFNPEDDFFNDICHQYDNSEGKDIILNDRRTEIYKNATFCENGCIYRNGL